MTFRTSLLVLTSLLAACSAAAPDTASGTDDMVEGQNANQVFLVNARADNAAIVLHREERDDAGKALINDSNKVSGGTGVAQTSTFAPLAIGAYVLSDSQGKEVGSFRLLATDAGNDVTIVCKGHASPAENVESVCARKLPDPAPPASTAAASGARITVSLGYGGLDTVTVHPDASKIGEEKYWAVGGTEPNAGVTHHLYAGVAAYIDVWSGGDKHGETEFKTPADMRFDGGSLLCWEEGKARKLVCELLSADGKLAADAGGKLRKIECNGRGDGKKPAACPADTKENDPGSPACCLASKTWCWSDSKQTCNASGTESTVDGKTFVCGEGGNWNAK